MKPLQTTKRFTFVLALLIMGLVTGCDMGGLAAGEIDRDKEPDLGPGTFEATVSGEINSDLAGEALYGTIIESPTGDSTITAFAIALTDVSAAANSSVVALVRYSEPVFKR